MSKYLKVTLHVDCVGAFFTRCTDESLPDCISQHQGQEWCSLWSARAHLLSTAFLQLPFVSWEKGLFHSCLKAQLPTSGQHFFSSYVSFQGLP